VIEKCAEKSRRRAGGDGTRAACAPQTPDDSPAEMTAGEAQVDKRFLKGSVPALQTFAA
jgi:hypothetical protein